MVCGVFSPPYAAFLLGIRDIQLDARAAALFISRALATGFGQAHLGCRHAAFNST